MSPFHYTLLATLLYVGTEHNRRLNEMQLSLRRCRGFAGTEIPVSPGQSSMREWNTLR
jgi:hypothetical protein